MNGSTVQWIFAILDAQKSRSLLKRLITESFDFPKLRTRFEEAVLVPIRHDVLRKFVTYTGYVLQQISRGRIEIDTHAVHTGFNYRAQASLQFSLIDIMLILSDADRFRICLHQLRQRVLEAARDRNRAAYRHIQLRKLFTRAFGGGIDRGAGLVDDDDKRIQLILRDDGRTNVSVSREAVPLPIAIPRTLSFWIKSRRVFSEPSRSCFGSVG